MENTAGQRPRPTDGLPQDHTHPTSPAPAASSTAADPADVFRANSGEPHPSQESTSGGLLYKPAFWLALAVASAVLAVFLVANSV
ncbi:MAG: hypothetical protein Q3999_03790 [Buchananella hordeovulneris]|nr:hypothetical protein [Buchananella hordeovulneris]